MAKLNELIVFVTVDIEDVHVFGAVAFSLNSNALPCLSVRDGKEFLGFDLDTVFDVNSIVSEVLL